MLFGCLLISPVDSPYAGGIYKVHVQLPLTYPYKSPSIGFDTPIYHPNVDEQSGSVCLDVINQTWSPMYDLVNIFTIFLPQLLLYPNPSDPLNGQAAQAMIKDKEVYYEHVRQHVKKYASKDFAFDDDENGNDNEEDNNNDHDHENNKQKNHHNNQKYNHESNNNNNNNDDDCKELLNNQNLESQRKKQKYSNETNLSINNQNFQLQHLNSHPNSNGENHLNNSKTNKLNLNSTTEISDEELSEADDGYTAGELEL